MGVYVPLPPAQRRARAQEIHDAAVALTRGRGAGDLALGRILLTLRRRRWLAALGFSRATDYARERGLSPSLARDLMRLARGCETRPYLRRAVLGGRVAPRKALLVLRVAHGADEVTWVGAAVKMTEHRLRRAVADALGGEVPEVVREIETVWVDMTAEQQDRLDRGVAMARRLLGEATARWICEEAMCQEWLSSHPAPVVGFTPTEWVEERRVARRVARQIEAAVDAEIVSEIDLSGCDVLGLDALFKRLVAARRRFEAAFCPVAAAIWEHDVWRDLGCRSLDEYAKEKLGMCERTIRQRAWLERRLRVLPPLRAALESGRLSYVKALHVAAQADRRDVEEWIARAESTTAQQLQHEADAAEHARNREKGVRRIWGPGDALETVQEAIRSAMDLASRQYEVIDPGEALARIADHFFFTWAYHAVREKEEREDRTGKSGDPHEERRRRILNRYGGFCAVPGCSNPAHHIHHILYRSRGGGDMDPNKVGLCYFCHRAVHDGHIVIWGEAGRLLVFEIRATGEVWIIRGRGRVLRLRVSRERQKWRLANPCRPWRMRIRRVHQRNGGGRKGAPRRRPARAAGAEAGSRKGGVVTGGNV